MAASHKHLEASKLVEYSVSHQFVCRTSTSGYHASVPAWKRNDAGLTDRAMMGSNERGQTTLDFSIGISLFLAVIVFVFAFVPGILAPFTSADERDTVQVGRVADNLTQGALGSPNNPYVLDQVKTKDFFAKSDSSLSDDLNLSPGTHVNVSVTGNVTNDPGADESELLCWSPSDGGLVEVDDCTGGTLLHRGGNPPIANDATIAAVRVVSLAGEGVTVEVVIW